MNSINKMKNCPFLIALIIGIIAASCNTKEANEPVAKQTKKKVKVASPKQIDQFFTTVGTGVLSASKEMKLSFKVSGIIQSVYVQPGQRVRQGQILAQIDQDEIKANHNKAEEAMAKAQRDFHRVEALYRDSSATLEQLQNVKTALRLAESDYEIASYNTKHAKITAPTFGTVLNQFAEEGELVSAGTPIFSIGKSNQAGSQILRVSITDKDLIKISLGDSTRMNFSAIPNKTYKGRITEIAHAANPATGTYPVEIGLTEAYYPELKNGFVGTAEIYSKSSQQLVAIPIESLVEGSNNNASIFLSNDEKTAFMHAVDVIKFQKDAIIIKADQIPSDAKIITGGSQYLSPNDSILIQKL